MVSPRISCIPCPACAQPTLRERGGFEVCPTCDWEDDGQDDVDAHVARGGPNSGTLWEARRRALIRGWAPDDRWRLVDDVAVEALDGRDPTPWALLHDGVLAGVVERRERVSLTVEIGYLRPHLAAEASALRLELFGCDELRFTPYEGVPTDDPDAIAALGFDIVEAKAERGAMGVYGSRGLLTVRCAAARPSLWGWRPARARSTRGGLPRVLGRLAPAMVRPGRGRRRVHVSDLSAPTRSATIPA